MTRILKLYFVLSVLQLSLSTVTAQNVPDSTMQKVKAERAFYETLGKIYAADSTVSVNEATIAGVKGYWFNKDLIGNKHIIIYLHGGVYALGSINTYRAMISHLAKNFNAPILYVEYSLSPEVRFPVANNEVLKVYQELKKKYPDYTFTIIGDSAGGGLAITLVHNCIESHTPLPNSLALISPWVDLKCDNNSYVTKQSVDPVLNQQMLKEHARYYAANNMKEADPSEFRFKQFPPVFLLVGTDEVLNDDSKNFYNYIKPIQAKSKLKEYAGQKHVWPVSNIDSEESKEAIKDINEFIKALPRTIF
jgi:monoterpene epsilon-lactone hydrolase